MSTIAILYASRTGTTKAYAEAMGEYLKAKGHQVTVASVDQGAQAAANANALLLGTWTAGLFIIAQGPCLAFVQFAKGLGQLKAGKLGLFATYKIATGGLFSKMAALLAGKASCTPSLSLKSRHGKLTEKDKAALDAFLA